MAEPTSQDLFDVLSSNYAALAALLQQAATSGEWAAKGDIYLNGYKIIGGHPDDETADKTVRIEGGIIELQPDLETGHARVAGVKTPQLKRTILDGSRALTFADDGTLFVAAHDAADAPIVLTLPAISDEYDDMGENVASGSTWYCQVFHAGSGVLRYEVLGVNSFMTAGVSNSTPVVVPPGKSAIAVYLGAGAWGVF